MAGYSKVNNNGTSLNTSWHEWAQGVSFLIPQQLDRIKCHNHALSMKYSICNIHLLPKAADLRKEAFDEFPLNMAILLRLLSRNALITFLGWLPVHSSFPGSLYWMAWESRNGITETKYKYNPKRICLSFLCSWLKYILVNVSWKGLP